MRNLKELYLDENSLTDQAAIAIAESPHLTKLTHLSLGHNNIKAEGTAALANSVNLANLTHLWLHNNKMREDGMQPIAMSEVMNNLEVLDVSQCEIGDLGVQLLAVSSKRRLKWLNLIHNKIGETGYKMLSLAEQMPLLAEIKIYEGNVVTTEAKNALRRAKNLSALRHIS